MFTKNSIYFILISLFMFTFGCASSVEDVQNLDDHSSKKSNPWIYEGGVVGDICSTGCVWSSYAVSLGVQRATHDCFGASCACVKNGNVYDLCQISTEPEQLIDDEQSKEDLQTDNMNTREYNVGDRCATGCIWSAYAVSTGAQSSELLCNRAPCACVVNGDIYSSCESDFKGPTDSAPESTPESTPNPSPSHSQPRDKVPYLCQYDNSIAGFATCQNTSIAMVLRYYGWRGTPDEITAEFNRYRAQDPSGLASLFNQLAQRAGIRQRVRANTNGSLTELKANLDFGHPVIVHAYTTNGHVVVVTGYDAGGYYVNDPAGRWNEVFKGSYSGGYCLGDNVYYPKRAFEAAIATSNGYDYEPLWMHVLD